MAEFAHRPHDPRGAEQAWLAVGVGRLVAAERTAQGWSAAECARRSGVGAGSIRAIERGLSRPAWPTLCRLAVAFRPDRAAAQRLAVEFAEAAGPSLAGDPLTPAWLARELVVEVLGRAAQALGIDLDDLAVRAAVVDELRAVTGESGPAADVLRAEVVREIGGGS